MANYEIVELIAIVHCFIHKCASFFKKVCKDAFSKQRCFRMWFTFLFLLFKLKGFLVLKLSQYSPNVRSLLEMKFVGLNLKAFQLKNKTETKIFFNSLSFFFFWGGGVAKRVVPTLLGWNCCFQQMLYDCYELNNFIQFVIITCHVTWYNGLISFKTLKMFSKFVAVHKND